MFRSKGDEDRTRLPRVLLEAAQGVRGETICQILEFINQRDREETAGTLVISGPAGIGKTWVIESVLDALLRSPESHLILRARGHIGETEFQFAGLNQLLRTVLGEAAALPVPERIALRSALSGAAFTTEMTENLHRVAVGALELLEELVKSQPIVLLLDNAQWLDAPTRRTLTYISHRLGQSPISMIIATRDSSLAQHLEAKHIALHYLDDETARNLVRQTHPSLPTSAVEHVVASAGGMPLALVEIPQLIDLEKRLEVCQNFLPGDVLDLLPPGTTLLENYRERISWMSTTELRAAVTVALEELTLSQLTTVFEQIGVDITDLAAAEHAGLVEWIHGVPRIVHPTVRGALHELVPGSEQVVVRKAIGSVLEKDPSRAAKHLVALLESTVPEVADTLGSAAQIASTSGEHFESGRLWELAARRTPPNLYDRQRERMRMAVTENVIAGSQIAAERCVRELLELAQKHSDAALEADAHMLWLEICNGVGTPLTWLRDVSRGQKMDAVAPLINFAIEAVSAAPQEVTYLLTVLMNSLNARGRHDDALNVVQVFQNHVPSGTSTLESELLIESIERGAGIPQPDDLLFGSWTEILNDEALIRFFQMADSLLMSMIWADSHGVNELIRRYQHLVTRRNLTSTAAKTALLRANLAQRDGYWEDALRLYGEAEQALLTTDFRGAQLSILLYQAWLTASMGDEVATEALVGRARKASDLKTPALVALTDGVVGMREYSLGRCESALTRFERSSTLVEYFGPTHPIVPATTVAHIEALWRMRRDDAAQDLLDDFEKQVALKGSPRHQALLARCHGLFATDFSAYFEEAIQNHARCRESRKSQENRDVDLARTELVWGMRLRRMRRKHDASKHFHRALDIFTGIGAQAWARIVRSELKACGERHADISDLPDHLKTLTPREYEIALEAARGRTNAEIAAKLGISPRTVEQHLGSTFQKLEIRSRTQLKGLVTESG